MTRARPPRRARSALALVALAAACSRGETPAGLVVVVDSDLGVPADIDRVTISASVFNGADTTGPVFFEATQESPALGLPVSLVILPPDRGGSPVRVRATASKGAVIKVVRDAITVVPADRAALLRMPLRACCKGVFPADLATELAPGGPSCGATETCNDGVCEDASVAQNVEPDYTAGDEARHDVPATVCGAAGKAGATNDGEGGGGRGGEYDGQAGGASAGIGGVGGGAGGSAAGMGSAAGGGAAGTPACDPDATDPTPQFVADVTADNAVTQITYDVLSQALFWMESGTAAKNYTDGRIRYLADGSCKQQSLVLADNQHTPAFLFTGIPETTEFSGAAFWSDVAGGAIFTCSTKQGCGDKPLLFQGRLSAPSGLEVGPASATESLPAVFWVDAKAGQVVRCPLTGCPGGMPEVLVYSQHRPTYIRVGQVGVYWLNLGDPLGDGSDAQIRRYDKLSGEVTTLAAGPLYTPTRISLWYGQVYLVEKGTAAAGYADGMISRIDSYEAIPRQVVASGQGRPGDVGFDNTRIYWNADGKLWVLPLTLCDTDVRVPCAGPPTPLVAADVGEEPVAVDDNNTPGNGYVYYVNGTGDRIMRVRKP